MSDSHSGISVLRRIIAVAVGLFAVWQFVYLPAANLIDFVPRRPHAPPLEPISDTYQARGTFTNIEPLQRAAECTGDVLDFWSETTGQEQGWSLFAPGLPPYCVIPATEFRFADGTSDTALSRYERADKQNPAYRVPIVNNRMFNSEAQLTYAAMYAPPEDIAKTYMPPEEVAKLPNFYRDFPNAVQAWRKPIRAWLAWRMKEYLAAHPERGTPTEVILKHRYILTPKPEEPQEWTRVVERPYARWRPADDSLEAYDAVNHRFVPVEARP